MDLPEFFNTNYKRGNIALVGYTDIVGKAIRNAERLLTTDGKPSKWNHAFILGDRRPDRNTSDSSVGSSIYLFESSITLSVPKIEIKNGAQENWIGTHTGSDTDEACVIDFGLSEDEATAVLATALQLVDEQITYPIAALIGFWEDIVLHKLWKNNPLDSVHAMVCSQYVRYCYVSAGRDFMGSDIAISNTAPEHIYQAGLKVGKLVSWR